MPSPAAPLAAPLVAPLAALLVCAAALSTDGLDSFIKGFPRSDRSIQDVGASLPAGCLYEGRWHRGGAVVLTRDSCLRCACAHGALSCRRRACAALPDPPPPRCHVLHRKATCCPELHCPDGVRIMEHEASGRFNEDSDIATPSSVVHACVEGGSVFAAGSALGSTTACEQCFCLGGGRRCVRPRCLPPPPGCQARPSPGACCPQRYYCNHNPAPNNQRHHHDCEVEGEWVSEGERVVAAQGNRSCTQCFCLRGSVHCQPLACAPPLHGCQPLLRPGECCPHQYQCQHQSFAPPKLTYLSDNSISSTKYDDRSFHKGKSSKQDVTTTPASTTTAVPKLTTLTNNSNAKTQVPISTTKVKRKTNETFSNNTKEKQADDKTTFKITSTEVTTAKDKLTTTTEEPISTTTDFSEKTTTTLPEGTVKIVINGTINCTAELSSTSMPLNVTSFEAAKIKHQAQPRVPVINIESQTFNPNDIITERNHAVDFDENETFTINVTSSLRTNTSTARPSRTTVSQLSAHNDLANVLNVSQKTVKGDFDYDYTEPTLPPSLPNLKIIPFVAADAVVEDDAPSSKEALTYPILEREDKYPIYYPKMDSKEIFASRREDVYKPYPQYQQHNVNDQQYPSITQKGNDFIDSYSSIHDSLPSSIRHITLPDEENHYTEIHKPVTKAVPEINVETPAVNLFSPPVETEGGFIPKGPGIIDEYYAVYPSTPSGHAVPNLTTSMQLDLSKEDCISGDGRRIPEGQSINIACSVCSCAWGELHCSPHLCPTPPGCYRRPATSSAVDVCCGELICGAEKSTTPFLSLNKKTQITLNETKIPNFTVNDTITKESAAVTQDDEVATTTVKILGSDNTQLKTENNQSIYSTMVTAADFMHDSTLLYTSSTTENQVSKDALPITTSTPFTTTSNNPLTSPSNATVLTSQEYDEEEEEEDGFSFGSVLKLLLSESGYETTTAKVYKKMPTTTTRKPAPTVVISSTTTTPKSILPKVQTTRPAPPRPSVAPFIPLPHHHFPYIPPKKTLPQNTVNRIDHLVLGEATAIRKSTPVTTAVFTTTTRKPVTKPATKAPTPAPVVKNEEVGYTSVSQAGPGPGVLGPGLLPGGGGAGLLKLAGCNIYGRMYRVGRIISELSTPCQECRCTELGVQCSSLNC